MLDLADTVASGSVGMEVVGALMAPTDVWNDYRRHLERQGAVSTGDPSMDRLYGRMRTEGKLTTAMLEERRKR